MQIDNKAHGLREDFPICNIFLGQHKEYFRARLEPEYLMDGFFATSAYTLLGLLLKSS